MLLENWGYPTKAGSFAHRDYFLHHATGKDGLFVGVAQTGTATGKQRFTVSRAVRPPDGRLKAVVVAGVFSEDMAKVFDEVAADGRVVAALVREDGGVLALGPGTLSNDALELQDHTADRWRHHILLSQPVVGYPARVLLGVPLDLVLGPWLDRSVPPLVIAVVATLVFAVLVGIGVRAAHREEAYKADLENRVRERTADLDHALDEARRANQVKDNFLATVSHDLRQPLQAMSLLAGVVSATASDERTRRLAEHVSSSLTYGQRLLNDLVDFSQIEAGVAKVALAEVDVAHLITAVAEEAADAAAKAGLRLDVRPCAATVHSDPVRLRQMLQNLVSNAIKHTPAGGRVLIAARPWRGGVRLQVWDTGRGIPADKIEAVFRQFYQIGNSARNSAHGVGLGLAIVRRTAELLGCTVTVRSTVGRGSVFTVAVEGVRQPVPA